MDKPKLIEDIVNKLASCLPIDLKHTRAEVEKQIREVLQKTFNKLDLVTREEFDAQVKVLAKTRKKLDELERKWNEMQGQSE